MTAAIRHPIRHVLHHGHTYGFAEPVVGAEALGAIVRVRTADGLTWECGPSRGAVRLVRPDECDAPVTVGGQS